MPGWMSINGRLEAEIMRQLDSLQFNNIKE